MNYKGEESFSSIFGCITSLLVDFYFYFHIDAFPVVGIVATGKKKFFQVSILTNLRSLEVKFMVCP